MSQSIVVGTDGSETANKALGEAAGLAALTGATLEIVSAFAPQSSQSLREQAVDAPADVQHNLGPRGEVEQLLEEAKEEAESRDVKEVRVHAREGDPADAILDVAEETGAELIVIGNKGMTGAKRFLLGSVPNKISHHSPCSVLIVKTV
ncbi:MAG: hypothetical protein QOF76_461 [Solirubrobacteraceae bacterium]|jgi:nucleotide-binding universal stress UspA family protein|nr:hypothetical protein [Solirubrobacteraceae bacterium]